MTSVNYTSNEYNFFVYGSSPMTSLFARLTSLLNRRRWNQFTPGQDNRTISYVYAMMMMT